MLVDFRPYFERKIEVHMHNAHPYFCDAADCSHASSDFISRSLHTILLCCDNGHDLYSPRVAAVVIDARRCR